MKISKRIKNLKETVDTSKVYSLEEAVKVLKENTKVKFNESIDVAVKLGIDPKHSDQMVRGVVSLPHGNGKIVKVAVFAKDAKAEEAKAAGADIVGSDDLIDNIINGKIEFDKCIATPDMMIALAKVAKILGPKGLMPNPKLGTVTMNIKDAVNNIKAGQIEFRAEKAGIVHAALGKLNFSDTNIQDNIKAFFDVLNKSKPSGAKGVFIVKASISSSMGVGLKLDLSSVI